MREFSKKLKSRHVNMIAIGGSIGTGLFLASGYSIAVGGPGGALCAYIGMAVIVYFLMTSLAEMSAFRPTSGSFCEYSTNYVGQSFGTAMGYNYWFSWVSAIAVEISASSLIMNYWFPHINSLIFCIVFFFAIVIINVFTVKIFGEIEFGLSFIKVTAIVLFIILGIFSIISTSKFGLDNWRIVGAPFHNGMNGFMMVFLFVGLSFQGTELVGVASGETLNPETTIPNAIKMVFWRLTLFYVISILIITLLVPYNNKLLLSQDSVITSPYTLIFKMYFGKYAADIVNFIILVAILSAANASLYSSSRILWYLGKSKQSLEKFTKINRRGVPIYSLVFTILLSGVIIMFSTVGSGIFFNYIVQISSLSGFLVWFGIALSHYKFRKNYLPNNNINLNNLKYKTKLFPLAPIISMVIILMIIIGQIFTVENDKRTVFNLFLTYLSILIFVAIYCIHKIHRRYINIDNKKLIGAYNEK